MQQEPIYWSYLPYISGQISSRAHYERTLEIIVSKGNHPQMALIQVSELL